MMNPDEEQNVSQGNEKEQGTTEKEVQRLTAKVKNFGNVRNREIHTDASDSEDTDRSGPSTDIDRFCAGMDPEALLAYAQARLKQRKTTSIGHRASSSHTDNSALRDVAMDPVEKIEKHRERSRHSTYRQRHFDDHRHMQPGPSNQHERGYGRPPEYFDHRREDYRYHYRPFTPYHSYPGHSRGRFYPY
ncbi:unnamed protein product [Cylicocyclus nassatus]|uniref:Uncharacterized protein n=1 Tax=Cylicocyclus nassatus TaxID=53992 RepID=A0AA36GTA4_CYLNA|nr:unnamed protein product [Cylicocyclus nassatus]